MNFGNSSKLRSRSARRSAVACAAMLPFTIAFATDLRCFGPLRQHPVAGLRARGQQLVLRAPGSRAPCRARAAPGSRLADHRAQVLAAAREARPELVQDDREALTVRAAHHAADQVLADRRDRVRRRQQVLAGALLAVRDLRQRRRRRIALGARLRRARTRPASRRSPTGAGSGTRRRARKSWKPGVVDLQHDRGRLSSVTSRSSTVPTFAPAIITSSPGNRECGVVEDRADLVVAAVVTAGAQADDDRDQHAQHSQRDDQPLPQSRIPHVVFLTGPPAAGSGRSRRQSACRRR